MRNIILVLLLFRVHGFSAHILHDDVVALMHLKDVARYESFEMLSQDKFSCFYKNETRANNIARNTGNSYANMRTIAPALSNQVIMFYGDSLLKNQFVSFTAQLWEADESCVVQRSEKLSKILKCPKYNITVQFAYSYWLLGNSVPGTNLKKIYRSGLSDTLWSTISESQLKPTIAVISTGHHWLQHIFRTNITDHRHQDLHLSRFEEGIARVNHLLKRHMNGTRILWKSVAARHYEDGEWDSNGRCDQSLPYSDDDVLHRIAYSENPSFRQAIDLSDVIRRRALQAGFEFIDTLSSSLHRGDAVLSRSHALPGIDCVHYCVPGAPDVWNKKVFHYIFQTRMS